MFDDQIGGIEHFAFGPELVAKKSSCLPTLPPAHATSAAQSERYKITERRIGWDLQASAMVSVLSQTVYEIEPCEIADFESRRTSL